MEVSLSPFAARILAITQEATGGTADEIVALALTEFATKRNLQHAIFRLDWIAQREAELAGVRNGSPKAQEARQRKLANGAHQFTVTAFEQLPEGFRLTLTHDGHSFVVRARSVGNIWHAMSPRTPEPPASWVGVTVMVTCRNGEPARFPDDEPGTAWTVEARSQA